MVLSFGGLIRQFQQAVYAAPAVAGLASVRLGQSLRQRANRVGERCRRSAAGIFIDKIIVHPNIPVVTRYILKIIFAIEK
jgi:hypothetical protein